MNYFLAAQRVLRAKGLFFDGPNNKGDTKLISREKLLDLALYIYTSQAAYNSFVLTEHHNPNSDTVVSIGLGLG